MKKELIASCVALLITVANMIIASFSWSSVLIMGCVLIVFFSSLSSYLKKKSNNDNNPK